MMLAVMYFYLTTYLIYIIYKHKVVTNTR